MRNCGGYLSCAKQRSSSEKKARGEGHAEYAEAVECERSFVLKSWGFQRDMRQKIVAASVGLWSSDERVLSRSLYIASRATLMTRHLVAYAGKAKHETELMECIAIFPILTYARKAKHETERWNA